MPLFLRSISNLTRWDTDKDLSELSINDLSADTITDLRTKDNKLSVYQVEDNRSNLDSIITAVAATREYLSHFDYLLFDPSIAEGLHILKEKTKGTTKDDSVNDCHWNLLVPSATKLMELAMELLKRAEKERRDATIVAKALDEASRAGRVKLGDRLREEVEKELRKTK
jgi:hypothetical protein